jgi:GNAT superfamily N-acetyltransferase
MRIEKYDSGGLKQFLDSELYRNMPYVPVSSQRAESWLHNPRLSPRDILLYVAFEGEEMIAYRCILPDRHRDISFGWLSGNWVRPDHRRKGLASMLFEEANADWGHHLMYTNYAPESKAVYDKSGRFGLYHERPGMRYYQRSSAAGLLGNRRPIYQRSRPLLTLADGLLNVVQDIRIRVRREKLQGLDFEEHAKVELEALDFLEKNEGTGFCLRGLEEFDWITSWPWIKEGAEKDARYFFSSLAPAFRNICLKIRDAQGVMAGFLWLVVKGGGMTLPYAVFRPGISSDVSRLISHYMQSGRISYLTTYQSPFINIFTPGPILGKRIMIQNYFATRDLLRQLPDPGTIRFQDGDGDVVFV